ncbi:MAG: ribonuclease Y [Parcubacteria group bacterium CG_4_10_14_0_8_um_filter_35_7]|nr:MAG: ribonuclease Y [Parcubacteria group bacterium CG_4_10_14_0_8_um_filter_35_7]
MSTISLIILLGIGTLIGIAIGYFLRKLLASRQIDSAEMKVQNLISEVKVKQKELLFSAKEKALKIIDEAKREEERRRREITSIQMRLEKRESLFDQRLLDLENKQQRLYDKAKSVERLKEEVKEIKREQLEKLEKIAALSKEDARKVLFKNVEIEIQDELANRIKKLESEASEEWERKARELLTGAIERCASSHAAETTTTTVSLPSDEMKGRIIGREGRNIKALEQLTGVEIIVDDTPEAIVVSGFSPIRRQLAKRALEKLILDGRIHPGRIEEFIEKARGELALDIKKAGEEAVYEVGIAGLDPKLIQIIGRLKYRTSYGQNVLRHSIEVANLSALLAAEIGANVAIAKKAGFLHDIGKAVDQEIQGTHPEIGRDIAKKFGIPEEIIIPILTHHEDTPPTLEAIVVKVADAISGARPGARKDTYENYIKRLDELEAIANSFEGVEKTYAIQAGREIRVFVTPEEISDLEAHKLARDIAKKIEEELKYPGEIKVNVIREMRIIEYAR